MSYLKSLILISLLLPFSCFANFGLEREMGTKSIDVNTNYFFIGLKVTRQVPVYLGLSDRGLSSRLKLDGLDIITSINHTGDFKVSVALFYELDSFRFRLSNENVTVTYRF